MPNSFDRDTYSRSHVLHLSLLCCGSHSLNATAAPGMSKLDPQAFVVTDQQYVEYGNDVTKSDGQSGHNLLHP